MVLCFFKCEILMQLIFAPLSVKYCEIHHIYKDVSVSIVHILTTVLHGLVYYQFTAAFRIMTLLMLRLDIPQNCPFKSSRGFGSKIDDFSLHLFAAHI